MRSTLLTAYLAELFVLTLATNFALGQYFRAPERVDIDVNNVDYTAAVSSNSGEVFFTHWVTGSNWEIYTATRDNADESWSPSE
jgi:hypothetical protein